MKTKEPEQREQAAAPEWNEKLYTLARSWSPFRIGMTVALIACLGRFAIWSARWPWMNDSQIFHYAVFLMQHGWAPYRQITDINLPGCYLSEFLGMTLFGASDFGFRLYDYFLLIALALALVSISRRLTGDWFPGFFAASLFALIHGSEGAWQLAQRDEVMAILVIVGYACLFRGVSRHEKLFLWLCGIALGLADTFKPTALGYELVCLGTVALLFRRAWKEFGQVLVAVVCGNLVVLAAVFGFLLWRDSLSAFIELNRTLVPYYAHLNRASISYMVHYSTPRGLLLLLPFAAVLCVLNDSWKRWEVTAILGGVGLSLLSYFVQGKGYTYHRYPFVAFALLWAAVEFGLAARRVGLNRRLGTVGVLVGCFAVAPFYAHRVNRVSQSNALPMAIVDDLRRFPHSELQGHIQCLDGITGCYSALYRLKLIQSTGCMGDQLLFSPTDSPIITRIREQMLQQFETAPPFVFVVTNYWYGQKQSFDMLSVWPEFAGFLRKNYVVVSEQYPGASRLDAEPLGYRVYARVDELGNLIREK